jgi:putative PIN family toxin of toxin-antitoxin system
MRVVFDTNVLVSGVLSPGGNCARLLELAIEDEIEVWVDERLLAEYERVLRYPRLRLPGEEVRTLMDWWRSAAMVAVPTPLRVALPDPDDLPFLEVACSAAATLVTGNLRHFPAAARGHVEVLTPAELLARLRRLP